ncbi:hypothetical protein KOW79_019378 [Hemibagrus wyckioides]|uniref:Uncharacterized protein n=1 Tax=Hemibagrus wyckioides TaxID=337641 RepID=A0A9D3N7K1_9TELE|nr:hypothetical protein KOW79_019378 [Hemibagrus wyckioides]
MRTQRKDRDGQTTSMEDQRHDKIKIKEERHTDLLKPLTSEKQQELVLEFHCCKNANRRSHKTPSPPQILGCVSQTA